MNGYTFERRELKYRITDAPRSVNTPLKAANSRSGKPLRLQSVEKASQSLRPQAQIKFKAFLPAACTAAKILFGSQTGERKCAAASRSFFKREANEVGLV